MRGIDLLPRRLPYLGGEGRGGGKDENNQRKYALTQVYILCPGPLGKWQVFIKAFYDFFFHLANGVCIHDPDRQWVHATALEGHVDVLRTQTERHISHLAITGEFCISVWRKLSGSQHHWVCKFGCDLWETKLGVWRANQMCEVSDLWLGLNVLPEQPLLVESVAGLPCDGVYRALVDLLLDCTQQQEERLTHCFLKNVAERGSRKSEPC